MSNETIIITYLAIALGLTSLQNPLSIKTATKDALTGLFSPVILIAWLIWTPLRYFFMEFLQVRGWWMVHFNREALLLTNERSFEWAKYLSELEPKTWKERINRALAREYYQYNLNLRNNVNKDTKNN